MDSIWKTGKMQYSQLRHCEKWLWHCKLVSKHHKSCFPSLLQISILIKGGGKKVKNCLREGKILSAEKNSLFNQIGHSIPPFSTFWWIFRTRRFGQKFYYDCSSTCISTLYVEVEPFSLVLIQFQADINNLIIFDTLISTFNTVDGDAV